MVRPAALLLVRGNLEPGRVVRHLCLPAEVLVLLRPGTLRPVGEWTQADREVVVADHADRFADGLRDGGRQRPPQQRLHVGPGRGGDAGGHQGGEGAVVDHSYVDRASAARFVKVSRSGWAGLRRTAVGATCRPSMTRLTSGAALPGARWSVPVRASLRKDTVPVASRPTVRWPAPTRIPAAGWRSPGTGSAADALQGPSAAAAAPAPAARRRFLLLGGVIRSFLSVRERAIADPGPLGRTLLCWWRVIRA